jgi:2,4-diaminopentanoate dehydrogenase
MLTGASHRIDSVHGRTSWNVDDYGIVALEGERVGETVKQFEASIRSEQRPPRYGRNVLGAMLASLGLTPKEWSSTVSPVVVDRARRSETLGVTFEPCRRGTRGRRPN